MEGDVNSVNGSIRCDSGVYIKGSIGTINGEIELDKTEVRHDITTINGNITLNDSSCVSGDIIVKGKRGHSDSTRRLKITIKDNSVVEGDIIGRDEDIDVAVYLTNGGKVLASVEGAEVIKKESN